MVRKRLPSIVLLVALAVAGPVALSLLFSTQTKGRLEINRPIDAPYLQGSPHEFELVFFGYVGCTNVCTPILEEVARMYRSDTFAPLRQRVGVTFVNLLERVGPDQPQVFASAFDPSFRGVYFLKTLDREGEIDHSDHLYLVHRDHDGSVTLINIYLTHPINPEIIIRDIRA